jgi:hypothetical protein
MRSSGLGNVIRSVLAVCVGMVGVLAFARVAAGASSGLRQHKTSLVGDYNVFTSRSPSGTLTLNSDGTWTRSNGDSGTWLVWKKNVVLDVFSSTVGNMACIYLGTAEATGISSRNDPGPINCHEARATWYAVRTTDAAITLARPTNPTTANPVSAPRVVGTYDESDTSGGVAHTLHIKADGHYYLIAAPDLEVGYWVVHNGAIAFAVVDSQFSTLAGCVFVGIPSTQGIGSAQDPGLLDCNGHRYRWHATRVKT